MLNNALQDSDQPTSNMSRMMGDSNASDIDSVNPDALNESSASEGIGQKMMRDLREKSKKELEVAQTQKQFNADFEIDFQDLQFDKKLSEGGYGIVYKGRWKSTPVAIKQIKFEIV